MGEQTLETQVAVIGGGPGGYAAAFRAADLGLEVTLINQEEKLGGMCLHRGCIPSKALGHVVKLIDDVNHADKFGVSFGKPDINVDDMRTWVMKRVVNTLAKGLENLAKQRDIQLIQARAVFEASNQVRLQGSDFAHVRFEHAILASGGHPLPLPGMEFKEGSRIMSPGTAVKLPDIPETLLVVGAGYSGLELASRYALLGSRVTIVEMLDRLLPNADPELVKPLAPRIKELVENVYLNTKVADLEENEDEVRVTLDGVGDKAPDLEDAAQTFDRVLIAIGTGPNSGDIGLDNTKVNVDDKGFVIVDEERRTDDEHIFAVGDVVGGKLLAHKAMYEGKVAAEVIAGEPAAFDVRCIPAVVYTNPQVAWCGLTEEEAKTQGRDIKVGRFPWGASGRALTMGTRKGLTKVIFDAETERVLGIGIVGEDAENMIAEGALAVEMGAVAEDLALTIHPHPTLSETEAEAAEAFLGISTHILTRRQ
jgi:dihydrolipoamide dehydrogenase